MKHDSIVSKLLPEHLMYSANSCTCMSIQEASILRRLPKCTKLVVCTVHTCVGGEEYTCTVCHSIVFLHSPLWGGPSNASAPSCGCTDRAVKETDRQTDRQTDRP